MSIRKETVSAEPKNGKAQEQELWDRISTTEGAERAEVLDELRDLMSPSELEEE